MIASRPADGGAVVVRTARLLLVALDRAGTAVVRDGVRAVLPDDRFWAPDYPTAGDLLLAGLVLGGGPLASTAAPWGPLQVRLRGAGGPDQAVGGIGFKTPPVDGVVEVGYGLARSVHGHGLATEAVAGMLELARRHGLRAVTAQTAPDNVASRRVLEKSGFARVSASGDLLHWHRPIPVPRPPAATSG